MGLDLCCDNLEIRVGSYSTFHRLKIMFIYNAIYYLKNEIERKKKEIKEDFDDVYIDIMFMKDLLKNICKLVESEINNIDYSLDNLDYQYYYENKEKFKDLGFFGLNGLLTFVLCQDTNSMIDSIGAEDIYNFLKITTKDAIEYYQKINNKVTLLNYLEFNNIEAIENLSNEFLTDTFYLTPILKKSINTGEDIYLT